MKAKIPERNRDLRRYAWRRRWIPVALYLIWIAIFCAGAHAYNQAHQTYTPDRLITGWKFALWLIIAAVLGFFLFRIRRVLTDRGYEGVVLSSGLAHTYASSADPGATSSINYDFRTQTYLVILSDDGKRHRIRFDQKPGFYLYYYEGSRICHFAGLPYPICDPKHRVRPPRRTGSEQSNDDISNGYLCAACGFLNNHDPAGVCGQCQHSLIDPAEVWGQEQR